MIPVVIDFLGMAFVAALPAPAAERFGPLRLRADLKGCAILPVTLAAAPTPTAIAPVITAETGGSPIYWRILDPPGDIMNGIMSGSRYVPAIISGTTCRECIVEYEAEMPILRATETKKGRNDISIRSEIIFSAKDLVHSSE